MRRFKVGSLSVREVVAACEQCDVDVLFFGRSAVGDSLVSVLEVK